MPDIIPFVQLGSTVTVVVLFLNYLSKRDTSLRSSIKDNSNANISLAKALQKLTDKIEFNSNASITNTDVIAANISATTENTVAIKTNGKH